MTAKHDPTPVYQDPPIVAQAPIKSKAFSDLLTRYNAAATLVYCNPDPTPADRDLFSSVLDEMGQAATRSVLKRVCDPLSSKYPKRDESKTPTKKQTTATLPSTTKKTQDNAGVNPSLTALRRELTRDLRDRDRLSYALDNATATRWNKNGRPVREIIDPDLYKLENSLTALSFGDGIDLYQDAMTALLDETQKQVDRNDGVGIDLTRPYTVRRLKKKVYIKDESTVGGWETVTVTPVQEVYKAIRRSISALRSVKFDPRNGYLYIEDLAMDTETETENAIYRRMPKFYDLGSDNMHDRDRAIAGAPAGLDGRPALYSADRAVVTETATLVSALALTTKQARVLDLRMRGYGNKAIATYMGVTENSIKGARNEIKRKAQAAHFDPSATPADPADRSAQTPPCVPDLSKAETPTVLVQGPPRPPVKADPATPSADPVLVYPLSLDCPALAKWLACPVYYHTTIEDDHKALEKWLACPVYYHTTIEDESRAATIARNSYKDRFIAKYGMLEYERVKKIHG